MKTSENTTTENTLNEKITPVTRKASPLKSFRPQKSMVKIKSLKPKRLNIAMKVRLKKTTL